MRMAIYSAQNTFPQDAPQPSRNKVYFQPIHKKTVSRYAGQIDWPCSEAI